jgi:hypothetical protein
MATLHFWLNDVQCTNGCSSTRVFLVWRRNYYFAVGKHRASQYMKSD